MAPKPFTPENVEAQKTRYAEAGQGQVHTFYDTLSEAEQEALYTQLEGIDPVEINEITKKALSPPSNEETAAATVEPLPESATASILDSTFTFATNPSFVRLLTMCGMNISLLL